MKRFLCLLLTVFILVCSAGCHKDAENYEAPANFYYLNAEVAFFEIDSVIAPEIRETADHNRKLLSILNEYLKGPVSDKLVSPFPANLNAIHIQQNNGAYSIMFSKQFSALSGLDLTIACSCICATVTELTGCQSVEIKSEGALPGNAESLVFTYDSLQFLDTAK